MKYEQYTSLIRKLEKYAEKNPKAYEFRVAALGLLGYLYFGFIITIFLLLPAAAVVLLFFVPNLILLVIKLAGKLIILLLAGAASVLGAIWSLVRSLWTKTPAPDGYELNRETVPTLFEAVEQTSDFLKAPRPQHILLIESFNAAVVTLPRYGVFGKRTYLLVGLPLLQAISTEQFNAVLAHEIGHISEKHGRSATWVYRLQEAWGRFLEAQESSGHHLSFFYARFLNWYFPYFRAYSFVLRRRQEREADSYAIQLVGAKPLGEALINLEIKSQTLSKKFWKDVMDESGHEKTPPQEIFTRMAAAFRESNPPQDRQNLSRAVAVNTGYSDSHPSLAERLRAIGYWQASELPDLPGEVKETASEYYLGKLEGKYSDIFNAAWQERVSGDWQKRHDELIRCRERLDELTAGAEPLTADELYEKAALTVELYGDNEAMAILRDLIENYPDHPAANFALGSVLLSNDDESGTVYIEKAMMLDRAFKMKGCEMLYYFLHEQGRDEEAKKYILTLENEHENLDLAKQERSRISASDKFYQHDFQAEVIEKILAKIRYYDEIKSLYLVRKEVQHYTDVNFYVLFLDVKKKGFMSKSGTLSPSEVLKAVAERLSEFGIHYFMLLENDFAKFKPGLEKVPNAKIYQNPRK